MKIISWVAIAVVVIVGVIVLSSALYVVDESQQVVITQFGDPVGTPIVSAGLYLKTPFIQKVNYFDKRLLTWDGRPTQIPTSDKKFIWVDTTARWRIVDALKFLQSVGTERSAHARLDDVIDSATRDRITSTPLYGVVRDSNREFAASELQALEATVQVLDEMIEGRGVVSQSILEYGAQVVPEYGIELVDVRIKRLNYVEEVRQKVYSRMISERQRVAEQFRSEGEGKKAEIEGMRAKELEEITSEAYKRAQIVRGKGDAEAILVYGDAYSEDPEFYSFLKTLETYEKTLSGQSVIVLTTDSSLYQYLKSSSP